MKNWLIPLVSGMALVAAAAAWLLWNSMTALQTPQAEVSREVELVRDRCNGAESVDRHLLQQSWYYDQDFRELAGAFGTSSFTFFKQGDPTRPTTDGAFCISGNKLRVTYFKREWVPVSATLSPLTMKFGFKLKRLGQDTYRVRALDRDRMVLVFESDGRAHEFFRKN